MKYVLEFGIRGGALTDNKIVPTASLAASLAASLVHVFTNDALHPSAHQDAWRLGRDCPRLSWQSASHFVSISKLDGVDRGPAASQLWRVDK